MRCAIITLVALTLLSVQASAASIKWTGDIGDGQWTTKNNWYPNQVPGPNDDVTISSGNVQITVATGVNTLAMGDSFSAKADLTLFKSFYVAQTMTVQGNGVLNVNTGLDTVSGGQFNIAGVFNFIDGVLGGSWSLNKMATANLGNGNTKAFVGCQFASAAPTSLSGVIALNQSSVLQFTGAVTGKNQLILQSQDSTKVIVDASAAKFTYSLGTFSIQAPTKLGQFDFVSGNMSIFDSMSFENALTIPANSYVNTLGTAVANFSNGLLGAGVFSAASTQVMLDKVNMTGAVNSIGGALELGSGTVGILTIDGGNVVAMKKFTATQLNLLNGNTQGSGIISGTNVYTKTKGFVLTSAIEATKTMTIAASVLNFGVNGQLTIGTGCLAQVQGTLQLTGQPYQPGVINQGTFITNVAVASQNINIAGAGVTKVNADLTLGSMTLSQSKVELATGAVVKGANTILTIGAVTAPVAVDATFGEYRVTCPKECDKVATPQSQAPTTTFTLTGR